MTDIPEQYTGFKSGYVSILGAPNAGKSTLLNQILGEKISITSKKPQTTRNRILGVLHRSTSQMIFFDTPGVFEAKDKLNVRIVDAAFAALGDADVVLAMVDVSKPDPNAERYLVKKLRNQNRPVILALNKIDLIEKSGLLEIITKWSKVYGFKDVVPISARHGTQVDDLIATMEKVLPAGPPFFPEDTLTDVSERFIVAELIREQIFRLTGEEIPYATAVTVDTFKEKKEGRLVAIEATIHLERGSQKGIIIGKNGAKLKQIGTRSREQIEQLLGTQVFLKLFVRIQKNWRKDTRAIRRFGY
ncbi:MAG: GTPase Era [Deltaproteobacteria bacterium]|jgi:GTP-binding protein Era|nr:GTPase Era [Deltaproteobacteria bacterium]MBW2479671.1 GTPase Era [Deltaproteobacteria bacterium]